MDIFVCESDVTAGKVLKYQRPNPIGEDIHLLPDGTIERDEDKIIRAQRIFLHNWYRPGGPGSRLVMEKYGSCPAKESPISNQN
jgi:hypothetical protein